jgi:putative ABC transport system permease protein
MSVRISGKSAQRPLRTPKPSGQNSRPISLSITHFWMNILRNCTGADGQVSEIVGILAFSGDHHFVSRLFGLASFSAERRVKEIGIRKVLGASVAGIIALLSRDFPEAGAVCHPDCFAHCLVRDQQMLQDFAYRINIDWWVFVLAGALGYCHCFANGFVQSIKAALMNPVKSLKSE